MCIFFVCARVSVIKTLLNWFRRKFSFTTAVDTSCTVSDKASCGGGEWYISYFWQWSRISNSLNYRSFIRWIFLIANLVKQFLNLFWHWMSGDNNKNAENEYGITTHHQNNIITRRSTIKHPLHLNNKNSSTRWGSINVKCFLAYGNVQTQFSASVTRISVNGSLRDFTWGSRSGLKLTKKKLIGNCFRKKGERLHAVYAKLVAGIIWVIFKLCGLRLKFLVNLCLRWQHLITFSNQI